MKASEPFFLQIMDLPRVTMPTFSAFADRLSVADWKGPDVTGFTPGRIKTEVLSGLTVDALAVDYSIKTGMLGGAH